MKVVGVIPARFKSSRFPGKPLVELNGIPMVIRVAQIVEKAVGKENTYIATDDKRIKDVVIKNGFKAVMTSEHCLTGTDRVYEFSKKIEADIYINIQGDEPLLNYDDIINLIELKKINYNNVICGMCDIGKGEDPSCINIPKVIVNKNNKLIYISRLPIPGTKDSNSIDSISFKKQVSIYAFNKHELKLFGSQNKKSEIEKHEDIEILRFFDFEVSVLMMKTSGSSLAVDVIEDVIKVEKELNKIK